MNSICTDWGGDSVQLLEESVMLFRMAITVIVGSHLTLEICQVLAATGMVANFSDSIKKSNVFFVKTRIEHFQAVIPGNGGWDMVGQLANILEVCVLDVLHQPILGICKFRIRNRNCP